MAKVNPMFRINANPNKAPSEIQKKYPSKFNPRMSRVSCPTVMFVGSICMRRGKATTMKKNSKEAQGQIKPRIGNNISKFDSISHNHNEESCILSKT